MTTIAYRDGVLAADGQRTATDVQIESRAIKIGRIGRLLFGAAGSAAWAWRYRTWVRCGALGEPPRCLTGSCGFLIGPDDALCLLTEDGWERSVAAFYAEGSGWQFALGAMAAGASAEEAVRAAARFDVHTGGEIIVLRR